MALFRGFTSGAYADVDATPKAVRTILYDAAGNPVVLGSTDVTDRAGRLLGHVTVDNATLVTDPSDRAARLLGKTTSTETRTDGTTYWPIPTGVYSFSQVDVPGVAAATDFQTLVNPTGSGKIVRVFRVRYNQYAVAVAIAKTSIRVTRVTAVSAGTLQVAATINKFKTSYPNAAAEVRTANPTVTAGAEWLAWPPPIVITAASAYPAAEFQWVALTPDEELVLAEGEGIGFRQTAAGDVDENFNFEFWWKEF